jgi:molecular chaperone DnaJ
MLRRDYYTLLGVSRTESASGVRAAFRELARRYHPERIGPRGAHFLQELVTAYHVLADPDKRRHYDQGLFHAEGKAVPQEEPILAGAQGQDEVSLPVVVSPLQRFATTYPPIEVTLMAALRNFVDPGIQPAEPMKSVNVQIVLSPDEAARGGTVTIGVPVYYPCAVCGGSGQDRLFPCAACEAQGMLEEDETVRVHIPAMVGDYTLIEKPVRGLGLHNLYLRLYVRVMA